MFSSVAAFLRARPNPGAEGWVIETCPAERYLDERTPWSVRETLLDRESALDTLAAPTFSWRPTELVRVMGADLAFIGAFNQEKAVDLGPESEAGRRYSLSTPIGKNWMGVDGWPGMWRRCGDAKEMFAATRSLLPGSVRVLAACACARLRLQDLALASRSTLPRDTLEVAERWARGQATVEAVRLAARRAVAFANSQPAGSLFQAAYAIARATECVWNIKVAERVTDAIAHSFAMGRPYETSSYEDVFRNAAMLQADTVRKTVPFRVLIEALVGMRPPGDRAAAPRRRSRS